jgi:hypothetical protein
MLCRDRWDLALIESSMKGVMAAAVGNRTRGSGRLWVLGGRRRWVVGLMVRLVGIGGARGVVGEVGVRRVVGGISEFDSERTGRFCLFEREGEFLWCI